MSCMQLLCKPNHTSRGEICKAKRKCLRVREDNQSNEDDNLDGAKATT